MGDGENDAVMNLAFSIHHSSFIILSPVSCLLSPEIHSQQRSWGLKICYKIP